MASAWASGGCRLFVLTPQLPRQLRQRYLADEVLNVSKAAEPNSATQDLIKHSEFVTTQVIILKKTKPKI